MLRNIFFAQAVRKHLWRIGTAVALSVIAALLSGVSLGMIAPVLMGLLGLDINVQGLPGIFKKIATLLQYVPPAYCAACTGAFIFLAILIKNLVSFASSVLFIRIAQDIARELRDNVISTLLRADMGYFSRSSVGTLSQWVLKEVDETAMLLVASVQAFSDLVMIIIFVAVLLVISWQLTLVTFLLLALLALFSQQLTRRSKHAGRCQVDNGLRLAKALHEVFSGIRLIKANCCEIREEKRLTLVVHERARLGFKCYALSSFPAPVAEVVGVVALLAIVLFAHLLVPGSNQILPAVVMTFVFILFRIIPLVGSLNQRRSEMSALTASAEVVVQALNPADKVFLPDGNSTFTGLKNGISFESVSFTYRLDASPVLDHVSFDIPKGATVALVGQSGAGKSTCADLLVRFYDPTKGRVAFDGRDAREYNIASLRRSIGIVCQDTFLFNDTIRYNIAYARTGVSDAEIMAAARNAQANEFIEQLPQGLDTLIGERGVMLSGGERQRLAIARVLLQDPDILILDEATSSLDTVLEHLVQAALERLLANRTTLVIAHRLSTVKNADLIVVLDEGKVVESGSHEELLSRQGRYYNLYSIR